MTAELAIVLPAFNEADRLVEGAVRVDRAVRSGAIDPIRTELIVVDDGSTDNTAELAWALWKDSFSSTRILQLPKNMGKGAAVRVGVAASSAPRILFTDADMAVDPGQIPTLMAGLNKAEIAIGSRSLPESEVEDDSLKRAVRGRTFSRLANTLTDVALKDTQCGFKAFQAPIARLLFHLAVTDRFAFDVEILQIARRLGLHIAEVPVQWRDIHNGTVRPVADPLSMVHDLFRTRRNRHSPSVAALEVSLSPESLERSGDQSNVRALLTSMASTLPFWRLPTNRTLILFPLCGAQFVHRMFAHLSECAPWAGIRNRSISLQDMTAFPSLAGIDNPWHLSSADHGSVVSTPLRFPGRVGARHPQHHEHDRVGLPLCAGS